MDQTHDEEAIKIFIEEISDAEERGDYSKINRKSIENRLRWYEEHENELDLEGTDVHKAYTMVISNSWRKIPKRSQSYTRMRKG